MKKTIVLLIALFIISGVAFSVTGMRPDLTVHKLKIDSSKHAKTGKVTITYTIKNTGGYVSQPTKVKIESINDKNTPVIIQTTPAIDPGNTYTSSVTYNIAKGQKYVFQATADYNNAMRESNEQNNTNALKFSVGRTF